MDIFDACAIGDIEYVRNYIDEERKRTSALQTQTSSTGKSENHMDVEVRNFWNQTILMSASANGHEDVAELLLDGGANINAQDKWGKTALMYALMNKHGNVAEFLLESGANAKALDHYGWTVFMYVVKSSEISMAQRFASLMIRNPDIPYSGVPMSSFIPRNDNTMTAHYTELVRNLIPMYVERAVGNSEFGLDMQRDIEEILGEKTGERRNPLTKKDAALLTRLLKALRAIDYTDRASKNSVSENSDKSNGNTSPAYDMEL